MGTNSKRSNRTYPFAEVRGQRYPEQRELQKHRSLRFGHPTHPFVPIWRLEGRESGHVQRRLWGTAGRRRRPSRRWCFWLQRMWSWKAGRLHQIIGVYRLDQTKFRCRCLVIRDNIFFLQFLCFSYLIKSSLRISLGGSFEGDASDDKWNAFFSFGIKKMPLAREICRG